MTGSDASVRPAVRIGDAERQQAAERLGEHLRAGRLDAAEYDERLERAFAARTAPELAPLFSDLPGGMPLDSPPPGASRELAPRRRSAAARPALAVLLLLATVAWVVFLHFPPFFLFPLLWFAFAHRRHRYGARWSGRYPRT